MDDVKGRSSAARSVVRAAVVGAFACWVIGTSIANLAFLSEPPGTFGMRVDYDGHVKGVVPGLPAAVAGIRPGDRIDLRLTAKEARALIVPAKADFPIGTIATLWLDRGTGPVPVTLHAAEVSFAPAYQLALILRRLAALIFIVVGGWLVLVRPSTSTWGFYLFCVGLNPQAFFETFSRYPSADSLATVTTLTDTFIAAGVVGLMVFGLRFGSVQNTGWRAALEWSAPFLFLLIAGLTVYPDMATILFGLQAESVQNLSLVLRAAILGVAVYALCDTYIRGPIEYRPRIVWVVIGLAVGVLGIQLADALVYSGAPFTVPTWFETLLLLLSVMLPLAVAYAVVKHRIIDARFVLNRALTYGILTAALLGCFSIIDWLVGRVLSATRLASALEILLAIFMSYYLSVLNRRLENVTERIFFRRRHEAEARLARVAKALPHASSMEAIDQLLYAEAAGAFELASAAVFRKDDGVALVRKASIGWPAGSAQTLDENDKLVLVATAEAAPVRVSDIRWECPKAPTGSARPILALPIMSRNSLLALVLFGAHETGEDIDPDEVRALEGLASGAAAGYEYVSAEQLRQANAALEQQVARLQADLKGR